MTAPDNGDLRQLVVGLVTQMYDAFRDGQDPEDPELTAGLMRLLPGLTTDPPKWSGDLPQTSEELEAVLAEHTQDAALQVCRKAFQALVYMISLFYDFTGYAGQTCPDIDVPEFLRQAGLRAASDE
jgi:hypothetical protein